MGEFADDALNQSIDEWLADLDDPEADPSDCGIGGYRGRYRAKPSGPGSCPRCGADTILREGKFGKFYGCSTFPKCKGSRDL